MPADLRSLLEPHVRRVGVSETARRAGVAQPSLSAWLAGRRTLPQARIEAVADAVGVELRAVRRRKRAS